MDQERVKKNNRVRERVKKVQRFYSNQYFSKKIGLKSSSFSNWLCNEKYCMGDYRLNKLKELLDKIDQQLKGIEVILLEEDGYL